MNMDIPPCNNTSVGILVLKNDQLLLLERQKYPFGYACPAGHVEDGEAFERAAKRELQEETGLVVDALDLWYAGTLQNSCRRPGGSWHYWKFYQAKVWSGELLHNQDEAKRIGWYSRNEIERLAQRTTEYRVGNITEEDWKRQPGLEPVWYDFLIMAGFMEFLRDRMMH